MSDICQNYSIINSENEVLWQFYMQNTQGNNDFGWFAFSNKLEKGQYFLKWNTESDSRIFPFYVFENYQTQFFIRYTEQPDFDNCFFFYTKKMCFAFDAEEYLVLDKILFAYRDYNNYGQLSEKDIYIIRQHPYLVTLVHILHLELKKEFEYSYLEHLPLPDLTLESCQYDNLFSDELPVISTVMNKYSNNKNFSFRPASIVDRTIDNIRHDLFWNNFTKIDDPQDWVHLYEKLVLKSKRLPIAKRENPAVKFSKRIVNSLAKADKKVVEERIDSLIGKIADEIDQNKIIETINSIGDVSKIADKLNLPPTKVLRNYDTYKEIWNKVKKRKE